MDIPKNVHVELLVSINGQTAMLRGLYKKHDARFFHLGNVECVFPKPKDKPPWLKAFCIPDSPGKVGDILIAVDTILVIRIVESEEMKEPSPVKAGKDIDLDLDDLIL